MENWILVAALSLDTLFACMAYGVKKIKIPFLSAAVIAAVGMVLLETSVLLRQVTGLLFPPHIIRYFGFAVLIVMGMLNLFQSLLKYLSGKDRAFTFNIADFSLVLHVCIDETQADLDASKTLSVREAFFLALTLSADSLLTGYSISVPFFPALLLGLFSFGMGLLAVLVGTTAGRRLCKGKGCNLSWLSGLLLIVIAFMKII